MTPIPLPPLVEFVADPEVDEGDEPAVVLLAEFPGDEDGVPALLEALEVGGVSLLVNGQSSVAVEADGPGVAAESPLPPVPVIPWLSGDDPFDETVPLIAAFTEPPTLLSNSSVAVRPHTRNARDRTLYGEFGSVRSTFTWLSLGRLEIA